MINSEIFPDDLIKELITAVIESKQENRQVFEGVLNQFCLSKIKFETKVSQILPEWQGPGLSRRTRKRSAQMVLHHKWLSVFLVLMIKVNDEYYFVL